MKNLKMKSARAALDLSQQQLADLVGQNVQVLVEIRRVSEQHSHHMVVAEKSIVAQIFVGQLVHHPDETGRDLQGAEPDTGRTVLGGAVNLASKTFEMKEKTP